MTSFHKHFSQLWRFAVCGGMGFILDIGSLTMFVELLRVDPRIGVVFSSIVGGVFVFFANKFFTFQNRERKTGRQAIKFLIVYGVSFLFNIVVANVIIWLGVHYLIAKLVAVGIGAVWNYVLSHGFIFRKKEDVDVVVM